MKFQIGELSEKHQKSIETHTHIHTHTHTHTHTHQKRLPAAEAVKKTHMSQKYV